MVTSSISWCKSEQSSQVLWWPSEQCLFFATLGSLESNKVNEMQCDGQSECSLQFWGYTIFKYLFECSNRVSNICFRPKKLITFSKDLKPFKPSAVVSPNPARLFRCDGLSSLRSCTKCVQITAEKIHHKFFDSNLSHVWIEQQGWHEEQFAFPHWYTSVHMFHKQHFVANHC